MAFAHSGMPWKAFLAQQFRTDGTVADVWLCAEALDACCIAAKYTYIVEHGSLLHELTVGIEFWVCADDGQCLVGNAAAVHHENVLQRVFFGIVFVDDGLIVHGIMSVGVRSVWVNF